MVFLDTPTNHLGNQMQGQNRTAVASSAYSVSEPGSWVAATTVPAWLSASNSRTPPARFYGLTGAYEGNLGCWLATPVWEALQMPGVSNVSNATASLPVHLLHSHLDGARQVINTPHTTHPCKPLAPGPNTRLRLLYPHLESWWWWWWWW